MHSTQVESKSLPPQESEERDLIYPAEVQKLIHAHAGSCGCAGTNRDTQRLQDIVDDAEHRFTSNDIKKLLRVLIDSKPSLLNGESQLIKELKKKFGVFFIKATNQLTQLALYNDIASLHQCGLTSLENFVKYFGSKKINELLIKLQVFKLINRNNVKFIFEQQVYLHFMLREVNGHDNFSQEQFDELIVGKIHHAQLTMLDSCLKRKNKMIFNLFLPHSNLTPGSIVKKFIVGDLDRGFKKK